LCDIYARAVHRDISPELILSNNKKTKIIDLMDIPKHLKKEEIELSKVFTAVISNQKIKNVKYNSIYQKLLSIVKNGGII
jgi:RAB protein geranylgeranyltransferase component A